MRPLNKFGDYYFNKYDEEPVKLFPYSSEMDVLAKKYIDIINKLTMGLIAEVKVIGSVAYKIPTADVEVAVYVGKDDWKKVLKILEKRFRKPVYSEKEFALFPISGEKFDFDIHVYCGYEGEVSRKLTEYILERPELIKQYREIKQMSSFSKREYQYRKNQYLTKVIKQIPI